MTAEDRRTRRLRELIADWRVTGYNARRDPASVIYEDCAKELAAVLDTEGDRQPVIRDYQPHELCGKCGVVRPCHMHDQQASAEVIRAGHPTVTVALTDRADTEGDRPMEICRCEHPKSSHYDHDDEGGTSCRKQFCECAAFIPTSRADTEGDRPLVKPGDSVAERGGAVDLHPSLPKSMFHQNPDGDWVCEHGTASDMHCCGCHSGFIFDRTKCTCGVA